MGSPVYSGALAWPSPYSLRLKESLDKAESKMIKLWGVIKLRENRKDITELEASRDALEGTVFVFPFSRQGESILTRPFL